METAWGICQLTFHIVTLGIFAPWWLRYREPEKIQEQVCYWRVYFLCRSAWLPAALD